MADNNNNNNINATLVGQAVPDVHAAAYMNEVENLKRLIEEEGHSPTLTFDYVYHQKGQDDISTPYSPLDVAIIAGATEAMAYLLEDCKVDPNTFNSGGYTAIHEAVKGGRTDCLVFY